MAQRAVTLPVQIRKVATIGSVPVINSLMFAMGAGDMIVNGLPEPFARQQRWKYQTVFAPTMANKPQLQGPDRAPDIEALLVEPDVVFTMDKPNLDVLQRHNLPVVFLAWREPGDVKVAMQLLGFHKPVVAERYTAYFDGIVARVAAGSCTQVQKPTVYTSALRLWGNPRLIAEWWIEAAGGTSVTNDGRSTENTTFTLEQLLAWDPDILILNAPSDRDIIARDERLQKLRLLPTSTSI